MSLVRLGAAVNDGRSRGRVALDLAQEFADEAAFREWYDSPAYQEALKVRLAATDSRAALVESRD